MHLMHKMVLRSQTGYHVARNVCRFQFLRFLSSDQQKYVSARKKLPHFRETGPRREMSEDFRDQAPVPGKPTKLSSD